MINKIITFSIKNKLIVGLFILALIGYGSYQFTQLPIDAVPDITNNQVLIITVTPSLGAPDVERLITFPIEQANSNIPGLKEIRSFSRFGLSLITIVFEDNVDIYWARQQVTERLKIAEQQIPKGIGSPELAPVTTGLGEIYQYVVRPKPGYEKKYSATELRTIQDWIVRRQLLGVKGVADVSSFGGSVKQYEIAVKVNQLNAYNLSVNDVFTALEKNNENTGGAYIEKAGTVLYIRTEGLLKSVDDIKNCLVKTTHNGTPLLIRDIAEVRIGTATRYGAITYNDKGEVAGAVVMMIKGENSSRVIKDVKEKIAQIKKTLPEGVELEPFLDRTKMVNSAINTVSKNLLEGALIIIFVLVLFLGNMRAGIVVASVIPLAMLFAIILMNLFGVSGNLMSLGALDFGLIVDGAVIIVEAVMHGLTHSKISGNTKTISQNEMDNKVINAAGKMMNSAVFGQLIILIVYLPILTLVGIEGKMFKPMAQTVAFALIGAFLLSLTYVPMMSALFLSKTLSHKQTFSDKFMHAVEGMYQRSLQKVLLIPKTIIATTLILFAVSLFVFARMGGEFIPELPEGDFAVDTRVLTGSSIETSVDAIQKSAHLLLAKFPEIEKIVGKTGSGEIPTDPMPMEASDMMIILKDKASWTSAKEWDELAEKMKAELTAVPGVTYSFQYPVAMRFNELMTGSKQDVVCKIVGENLDTLSRYAKLLGNVVNGIKGAINCYVEPIDGLPQLIITYNRSAMAQYSVNIQEVNKIVNTAFAGQSCGLVYEDEKRFDLVVRLADEQRTNLEDVQNLLIPLPGGNQIPLQQLAEVSIKESINQIQRDDAKRRIVVGFNVHERDVETIVEDLKREVEKKIKIPSGYYITYGGAFENLNAAKKRLSLAVPLSLALILVLLYFAFQSIKQGLMIYTAIPLSAIGGILFLAARGMPFSISAGVGFIALFGVAVLNGIVLLAEFNRIRQNGESNLQQVVIKGSISRLRPVLMTALVASLGFLPMALSNGDGAEVQRPLATVVIGGLMSATLLTLFVLPLLYVIFENRKVRNSKVKSLVSVLLILCLVISTSKLHAQNAVNGYSKLSLQQAIDTALKSNYATRADRELAEYQKKLIKASVDIPSTNVQAEYGQLNSSYNDTRYSISQSIQFPTVYARQKSVQNQTYQTSVLAAKLSASELKRQVTASYYELVYLHDKYKLLLKMDSLFQVYLQQNQLRFDKGDINLLQKLTTENQHAQLLLQLQTLLQDKEIALLNFNFLLNASNKYEPELLPNKLNFTSSIEAKSFSNHLQIQVLQHQELSAQQQLKLQRAKLLPSLTLSFASMSMQGVGADNKYYSKTTHFNALQVGLALPIFYGAQRAQIKAAQKMHHVTQLKMYQANETIKNEYAVLLTKFQAKQQALNYYETIALPNSHQIIASANLQLTKGEINFIEFSLLINQAIEMQSKYCDAVNEYNQTIIQLNYLTQTN